jgi:hypothetical protein
MAVKTETTRMSVYIPKRLADFVKKLALEENTSNSGIIVKCLENLEKEREESLMIEGYQALANEQRLIADIAFSEQSKIALR